MSFDDLREQKVVADQVRRSLKNGRLAHAYLFIGRRGGRFDERRHGAAELADDMRQCFDHGTSRVKVWTCDEITPQPRRGNRAARIVNMSR